MKCLAQVSRLAVAPPEVPSKTIHLPFKLNTRAFLAASNGYFAAFACVGGPGEGPRIALTSLANDDLSEVLVNLPGMTKVTLNDVAVTLDR